MVEGIPVQKVVSLRSQGMSNESIIQTLRGENFSFPQIRDAIQQADIKSNVSASPATPVPATQAPRPATSAPRPVSRPAVAPAVKPVGTPSPRPVLPSGRMVNVDLDQIQRIMEEIIEEKWDESEKDINSLKEWKAGIEAKLKEFDSRFNEFNSRIEALNTVLGQKAENFNETMQNVDTEIKALEKALNKLVPTLSDNISELKNLVGSIDKGKA